MGRMPEQLRLTIAANIRHCRKQRFPGRGGMKECAAAFGVSPQQWSPWESGSRTPSESRLAQMACFFQTTVEWLRTSHDEGGTGENDSSGFMAIETLPMGVPATFADTATHEVFIQIMEHVLKIQSLCSRALTEESRRQSQAARLAGKGNGRLGIHHS